MADDSDPKPVTPSTGSGDNGGQPSTPPPSIPPSADGQTSTTVAPEAPPATVHSSTDSLNTPNAATQTVSGNTTPRPDSSLSQNAGQEQSSSTPTQQQQHQPALPPRTYPRDPQWLQHGSLPAIQTSRVLPRFFKILSIVIFITGSSATLFTILYQRVVLPKLLLTRARLASLHQHQTSLYDKLVLSAQSLVYSNSNLYPQTQRKLASLIAPDPTLPAVAQADIAKVEEVAQEKSMSESEEEEPLFADESPLEVSKELAVSSVITSTEGVTAELQASLSRLRTALRKHATERKTAEVVDDDEEEETGLPAQTPAEKTMKSLEELSTFLTNEAFYASTPAFSAASYGWNYGASSSIPQRSGMDREKIAQVKNEIRSLKGMLLTRRNFAIPRQEIQV